LAYNEQNFGEVGWIY